MLIALLERSMQAGASEMEVEYQDGWEEVYAVGAGIGVGIARLHANSAEARTLREELYAIPKKGQIIQICGCEYMVRVRVHQSCGEDMFRVTLKKSQGSIRADVGHRR